MGRLVNGPGRQRRPLRPLVAVFALLGIVAAAHFPAPAAAQEVALLAGSISSANSWPRSYAWSFSYREPLPGPFSLTWSYLNQGHFPGHHRDGITAEVWAHADLLDGRL